MSLALRRISRAPDGECYRWEGIPKVKNELVASLLIGTMVMFMFALVWGRELVDLIGRLI